MVLRSSIAKKYLMAITGLFLISFLAVHCFVNSLIFFNDNGETFNTGAKFMGTNLFIKVLEYLLFIGFALHILMSLVLTIQNKNARKQNYEVQPKTPITWYSKSMGILGLLILIFLIWHLKDFWYEKKFTDNVVYFNKDIVSKEQYTFYMLMLDLFKNPWIVLGYTLSIIALAYHLLHGFQSAFQSLGLMNKKYGQFVKQFGNVYTIIISILFIAMPLSVFFGIIK